MTTLAAKVAVAVVALGLSSGGFAQAPAQGPAKGGRAGKARKAPKPSAAQPQPPAQPALQVPPPQPVLPPRPEQMPPTAPQVTYQDGQLTIVAQNSTLSSILTAVRARTGAQVEMPADTSYDRVAVNLGPGNPREVLSSLLQGSRFDYIVLGSANNPDAVSHVILTPHTGGPGATAAAVPGQPGGAMSGGQPMQPGAPLAGGVSRPEMNADEDEPAEQPAPPQPPEPAPGPSPQTQMQMQTYPPGTPAPNMQGTPGQAQSTAPGQSGPQVKTPEQLLQELQRIQQQQRQQQQQQQQPPQPQR